MKRINRNSGNVVMSAVLIVGIVIVVAAIIIPVFVPTRHGGTRKHTCINNLKQLGTSITLYHNDYDGQLPSSFLYGRNKTWNKRDFVRFASVWGSFPQNNRHPRTYVELLGPYLRSPGIIWCPNDPGRRDDPSATVSYFWKAAVDRAWYGNGAVRFRSEADYPYPTEQIILYERASWHWSEEAKGLSEQITLNMVFMDGHVATRRIKNSGYAVGECSPLPKSGVGEPAWFNYNISTEQYNTGANWNPTIWADDLP